MQAKNAFAIMRRHFVFPWGTKTNPTLAIMRRKTERISLKDSLKQRVKQKVRNLL
jgi:hypothetical protein